MPEEVNRIVTDSLSDLLFATSPEALSHLAAEGVPAAKVHLVGNPMIDSLFSALPSLDPAPVVARLGLPERYAVATLHRPANVDDPEAAHGAGRRPCWRCREQIAARGADPPARPRPGWPRRGWWTAASVRVVDPLGYVDFLSLVRGAALVVTDSGGVQEETTMLGVPCLTVRPNTERPITITHGTNRLVTPALLPAAAEKALADGAVTPSGDAAPALGRRRRAAHRPGDLRLAQGATTSPLPRRDPFRITPRLFRYGCRRTMTYPAERIGEYPWPKSPEEPTFQRLGPVNWLPEERKLVERYEDGVRELRGGWRSPRPRPPTPSWKLEATQAKRTFKLGEATGSKSPGKMPEAVTVARHARRPSRPRRSPRRSSWPTTGRRR